MCLRFVPGNAVTIVLVCAQQRKLVGDEIRICRRQKEASARAAAIGHATIRLLLPFGMVVEVDFGPLEQLQHLFVFVKHVVLTQAAAAKFSLFLTPPKHTLKGAELQKSFWDLSMVPGAYVHVEIDDDMYSEGLDTRQASQQHVYKAFLRSEVLAAQVDTVPVRASPQRAQKKDAQDELPKRAGGKFASSQSSKVAASGKVPKWFKSGK